MRQVTKFEKQVYKKLEKVLAGKVTTYGELARVIGKPRAARAVGNALNRNPYAPQVPCHRVVKRNGQIGGFASGQAKKIRLLKKEGIVVSRGRVVDFTKIIYTFK